MKKSISLIMGILISLVFSLCVNAEDSAYVCPLCGDTVESVVRTSANGLYKTIYYRCVNCHLDASGSLLESSTCTYHREQTSFLGFVNDESGSAWNPVYVGGNANYTIPRNSIDNDDNSPYKNRVTSSGMFQFVVEPTYIKIVDFSRGLECPHYCADFNHDFKTSNGATTAQFNCPSVTLYSNQTENNRFYSVNCIYNAIAPKAGSYRVVSIPSVVTDCPSYETSFYIPLSNKPTTSENYNSFITYWSDGDNNTYELYVDTSLSHPASMSATFGNLVLEGLPNTNTVKNYHTNINNINYNNAYQYNNYIYAYDDSNNLTVYITDDSGNIVGDTVYNEGDNVYNVTIYNVEPPVIPTSTPAVSPVPSVSPAPVVPGGNNDNDDIIAFLTTAFANITTNIRDFFSNLSANIKGYFDDFYIKITNYFDNKQPVVSTPETAQTATPSPTQTPEPLGPIIIDKQPDSVSIKTGTNVKFGIEAHSVNDSELSYFWEWSSDDGDTWRAVSQRVSVISTATNLSMNGRLFRCTVSDTEGNSLISTYALLTVWEIEPTPEPTIPPVIVPGGGDNNYFDNSVINNWISNFGDKASGLKDILFALPAVLAAMFAYVLGMREILMFIFPFFPDYIIVLLMCGMIISLLFAIIRFIRYMTS